MLTTPFVPDPYGQPRSLLVRILTFEDAAGYETPCDVVCCLHRAAWTVDLGRQSFKLCRRCLVSLARQAYKELRPKGAKDENALTPAPADASRCLRCGSLLDKGYCPNFACPVTLAKRR